MYVITYSMNQKCEFLFIIVTRWCINVRRLKKGQDAIKFENQQRNSPKLKVYKHAKKQPLCVTNIQNLKVQHHKKCVKIHFLYLVTFYSVSP